MTDNSTIADKLDEARALIEKGWCQHAMERAGSYCSLGALSAVLAPIECDRLLDQVTGGDALDFNEAPGRTQAEVIEAFRKAAELARQEQVA